MKYFADYTLQFDCGRTTGGRWVAICDTLPGIRSRRATEEAALREAARAVRKWQRPERCAALSSVNWRS
jgi:hypothetical protein